ncbi:MAG TPA: amino acid permease [candidate division Zixibacteria bacterium]|nr:amino acid permease [candidate division Zixibacteria bacterium]
MTTTRHSFSKILLGRPLDTAAAPHQVIGKIPALAVFASDALSSVAYATEEILVILALTGAAYFYLSIPIAVAISVLLVVLTISYRQTIFAYPGGGGAYIVARDNLGELPALTAGAALLTDYILTVAVSISSGVAQITSAFPALHPYRVDLAVMMILIMTVINLRGVKESSSAFAMPTYFFLGLAFLLLGAGAFRLVTGTLGQVTGVEMVTDSLQPLTLFIILRAFSSGCTALTGVEAISNGIPAFKEPRSRNAANTLLAMSGILMTLFIGITFLARAVDARPSEAETVISQIARTVYGDGLLYLLTLVSTTVILIMAANTSFADFPRLAALQAGDGFLPRQLTFRGSRLVFSWGIFVLAGIALLLVIAFQ